MKIEVISDHYSDEYKKKVQELLDLNYTIKECGATSASSKICTHTIAICWWAIMVKNDDGIAMRELVIEKIKKFVEFYNETNSWRDDFEPKVYPDFDKESDKALFDIYENSPRGPCG